jgi:hypothetical protein
MDAERVLTAGDRHRQTANRQGQQDDQRELPLRFGQLRDHPVIPCSSRGGSSGRTRSARSAQSILTPSRLAHSAATAIDLGQARERIPTGINRNF